MNKFLLIICGSALLWGQTMKWVITPQGRIEKQFSNSKEVVYSLSLPASIQKQVSLKYPDVDLEYQSPFFYICLGAKGYQLKEFNQKLQLVDEFECP